jgi:hypothetical protein
MSATFREVYPALDESLGFILRIEASELRPGDTQLYSAQNIEDATAGPRARLPKIIPPPFYLPLDTELRLHIERGRLVVEMFKRV